MTDREPTEIINLDGYGNAALPWSRARERLIADTTAPETPCFLTTIRPDGRPHTTGIGLAWHDGDLYFTSGPGARKSRNLTINPACTIACRVTGLDLTLDGEAHRVTDAATLERVAAIYREGGWPAEVAGDAFTAPYSAPSAGPPPWQLYRFVFASVVGLTTLDGEPYGVTRWRFASR